MNQVDYLHQNKTESLILEKKVEVEALDVHQQEDVVLNQTAVTPADIQQKLVIKTEVHWSSSLDQQDPELLHIKEEEEEMWSGQEEDDTGNSGVLFSSVKSEEDEDKPQLLQLHQIKTEDCRKTEPPTSSSAGQMKTEADVGDCGEPEPDRNQDPNAHLQSNSDENASDTSETDDDDDYSLDHFTHSQPEGESGLKQSRASESENSVRVEGIPHQVNLKRAEGPQTAGKTFRRCQDLSHIRGHKGENPCGVCHQTFRLNCLLKYQLKIHTGEKPFECGVCGKKFKRKWLLRSHCRIHIEVKPFDCEICGKKFRHLSGMKCHMRTHTGEKPFKCNVCNRKFAHMPALKDHMKVHRGEKKFECEYCDEKIDHEADFNDHMMDHKRKMPFSCSDCGKLFKLEFNLKRHLMVHRGEKSFDWDFFGENV